MNLTNFLRQVDGLSTNYSTAQLAAFVHEIGRILPKEYRKDFLKRLRAKGENDIAHITDDNQENALNTIFNEQYISIKAELNRIEAEELCISAVLNEMYEEWYDNEEEEFFYTDDDNISCILKKACVFVHRCTDEEKYAEGLEIGRFLFSMQIICNNEYYDAEEFSIHDMVRHELVDYDIKKLILDTLYCGYHSTPLSEKAEVLYEIIMNAENNEITLEALIQYGDDELPQLQEFLTVWTKYLGEYSGRAADRLFAEAVGLQNNIQMACSYADKYLETHPGLYLQILENNSEESTIVDIGLEAIHKIPAKYVVRSAVALKTAEYAIAADKDQNVLEICYYSSYESDTNAISYLRALLHGFDCAEKREQLRKEIMLYASLKKNQNHFERYSGSERQENRLDENGILLLQFFDGQFAEVLSKGLNRSKALGWTGTFMKQGIALFLLYLYEGDWERQGILAMADRVRNETGFTLTEYQKGISDTSSATEKELFHDIFIRWKKITPMEQDVKESVIKKISSLLKKRTEGIMDANRRNYYGECAAFIAALGEVRESLGETNAKQKLMTSYKEKYSRRRAFHSDMKFYGWKG